eukprot:CAMPEP_0194484900 /NCGR_PEP_ID=MMETSP0253-20130528/6080_1 /TAXON_ID=2966 /ORGANISM="Noctiluca scintillans" /LENGTH=257 /DNA_ID=CAMNT_0039324781 /DNA_START=1 /DNA_END=771 /DNA_ORIENTATION=+
MDKNNELTHRLQDVIENRIAGETASLNAALGETNFALKNLRADRDQTQKDLVDLTQVLRSLANDQQNNRTDLLKTNTVVHILEQRLQETAHSLKSTRTDVEDHSTKVRNLEEGLCCAQANLADLQEGFRKVGARVKQVHEGLQDTSRSLHATQGKLDGACGALDAARKDIAKTHSNVSSLQDGHNMLGQSLGGVQQELREVGAKAHATHSSLKKTNQMVLPNLAMDGEAKVRVSSPSTPVGLVKKKVSSGTPNRMSW